MKTYLLTLYSEEYISIGLLGFLEGSPGHPQAGMFHTLLGLPHFLLDPTLAYLLNTNAASNHNRKIQIGVSVMQYQPLKNKFGGMSVFDKPRYALRRILF